MAYDATAYINDAIHEVVKTLIDTLLIVMVVIFLVPRFVALGHRADRRDSDFAHRRVVPHADVRLHAESAHAARDRAFGRVGRRRRHRRRRKRRAAYARRIVAHERRAASARAN